MAVIVFVHDSGMQQPAFDASSGALATLQGGQLFLLPPGVRWSGAALHHPAAARTGRWRP